jgi:hypothetical protein
MPWDLISSPRALPLQTLARRRGRPADSKVMEQKPKGENRRPRRGVFFADLWNQISPHGFNHRMRSRPNAKFLLGPFQMSPCCPSAKAEGICGLRTIGPGEAQHGELSWHQLNLSCPVKIHQQAYEA